VLYDDDYGDDDGDASFQIFCRGLMCGGISPKGYLNLMPATSAATEFLVDSVYGYCLCFPC